MLFTLEQKEVMIEFYNRQAQYGIRADADDCIAEMKVRGLNPLRQTQITSWWSSYHQKRRGTERVAADLQQTPATTAPTAGSTASSTITATVSSAVSSMPATTSVIASTVTSATAGCKESLFYSL